MDDSSSLGDGFGEADFSFDEGVALQSWPAPTASLPQPAGVRWTASEQQQLETLLALHPSERYNGVAERYIVIASHLPSKTARDVALRVKWMSLRAGSHPHHSDQGAAGLLLNRAGSGMVGMVPAAHTTLQTSHSLPLGSTSDNSGNLARLATFPHIPPPASGANTAGLLLMPPPHDSPIHHHSTSSAKQSSGADNSNQALGTSSDEAATVASLCPPQLLGSLMPPPAPFAGGLGLQLPLPGVADDVQDPKAHIESLLQENDGLTASVKVNMEQGKVMENTELLAKCRDNLLLLLQHMDTLPGPWRQVPPLPVQINFTMAARLLPPPRLPLPTTTAPTALPTGGPTMVGPTTNTHHSSMMLPSFMGTPGMSSPHMLGGVLSAGMIGPNPMLPPPPPFMHAGGASGIGTGLPGGVPGLPPFPYPGVVPPLPPVPAPPGTIGTGDPAGSKGLGGMEGVVGGLDGTFGGPFSGPPFPGGPGAAFGMLPPMPSPLGAGAGIGATQPSTNAPYPMSGPF